MRYLIILISLHAFSQSEALNISRVACLQDKSKKACFVYSHLLKEKGEIERATEILALSCEIANEDPEFCKFKEFKKKVPENSDAYVLLTPAPEDIEKRNSKIIEYLSECENNSFTEESLRIENHNTEYNFERLDQSCAYTEKIEPKKLLTCTYDESHLATLLNSDIEEYSNILEDFIKLDVCEIIELKATEVLNTSRTE